MIVQTAVRALIVLLLLPAEAPAAGSSVSLNALTEETQRISEDPERLGFVWWLPVEFWEATLASGSAPSTPEQISAFTSNLRDYTSFAVADGTIGELGGVTWASEEALRSGHLPAGFRRNPLRPSRRGPGVPRRKESRCGDEAGPGEHARPHG